MRSNYFDSFFVLSLVLMNILANKSIALGVNWLALDCGIIISWGAFLSMDIIVRRFGPKASIQISMFAICMNLAVALIFFVASLIAGTWSQATGGATNEINTAINNTLSVQWYVLLGSTIAFACSAVLNSVINWSIRKRIEKNPDSFLSFAICSYTSTFLAQIVDNLIFALIVSMCFFGWSFVQCLTCAIIGAVVETVCEAIFSPIGHKMCLKMQKEGIGEEYLTYIATKKK